MKDIITLQVAIRPNRRDVVVTGIDSSNIPLLTVMRYTEVRTLIRTWLQRNVDLDHIFEHASYLIEMDSEEDAISFYLALHGTKVEI